MPDEHLDIRKMTRGDLDQAARWHAEEFPEGFYPQLGVRFLAGYYRTFLNTPYAVALVAVAADGRVVGYLTGIVDERRHVRRVLVRHTLELVVVGLLCLLRRPTLWRDFLQRRAVWYLRRLARATLDCVAPRPDGATGELSYIVTAREDRGAGVGGRLLGEFRDRAVRAGTGELRLVTAADVPRLSSFYQRHGWLPAGRRTTLDGRALASFQLPLAGRRPAVVRDALRDRPRLPWSLAAITTVAVFAVACGVQTETAHTPTPSEKPPLPAVTPALTPTPSATPTNRPSALPVRPTADPVIRPIPSTQWKRIVATGTWRAGCPVGQADLRRVEVNHYDFSGRVKRGVLVVHRDTAAEIATVFTALFNARFPIRQMRPVEEFGGDNTVSMAADNTSAYNCRRPGQINAPVLKSPHANGRAVDINPAENPWVDLRCKCWQPSARNSARKAAPGVITKGGTVWRLFTGRGWIWQNIDTPDYMHFDTGYPSAPLGR
ncbi:acetyltransferase (GNAT) family protein [Kribbella sp. VKM Ac-2527]|uniref:Acetyltransferase (GNAT) family protein n=1 Tax=Kribbella caucasensis TaxID=2512215 RepID=A0A4R6KDX2_9ACTN|nr:GNAT family N-acetyltransferase [Kribbella sp. VKM Ac-2527]TDO48457.1 acetyltransferase (GNAT) family protein [Kribbella sp. VKM Ac-2527]